MEHELLVWLLIGLAGMVIGQTTLQDEDDSTGKFLFWYRNFFLDKHSSSSVMATLLDLGMVISL